jgi:serine/threonine protein kinase
MTAAAPPQPDLTGAILSRRFRLLRMIGEGGMGAVYATDQNHEGAPLAVKILHPEFLGDQNVLVRFLEEARASQRLIHPNILRVFESTSAEDGSPYLVMELLEGVPLSAYTRNGGRVPITQAIAIVQGILQGLGAAHAQGIVHRDLKPENVFLSRDRGGHFVVKLLDFGIAKVMDVAGGMGSKTRTGALLGTPAYMSPEQAKNSKDVDARADLWSVGVMFYEMLTGIAAFPAPTPYARLYAVVTNEPRPIGEVDPLFAGLLPFFARALKKDRTLRFQSAAEMAKAIGSLHDAPNTAASAGAASAVVGRLSHLPSVSIFASSVASADGSLPASMVSPVASSVDPTLVNGPHHDEPANAPGGTLTSAPQVPVAESAPIVVIVGGAGGTLPSEDLPKLSPVARGAPRFGDGVRLGVVFALVLIALLLGFIIGFLVARAL